MYIFLGELVCSLQIHERLVKLSKFTRRLTRVEMSFDGVGVELDNAATILDCCVPLLQFEVAQGAVRVVDGHAILDCFRVHFDGFFIVSLHE